MGPPTSYRDTDGAADYQPASKRQRREIQETARRSPDNIADGTL